ncbi:DUF1838 family protein [Nostoc sp. CMAA1605]|uniref:DUF1838 family protein n=1 Tax=Nostoc sp. CMAA1605 TaxID=2055159 RepID=UPI001F1AF7B8|nr:DUF1838 family protein [Nostoc sp. CMAA1605]MCF4969040.1 hypothetical protein [Nostoc sp. CMAA1605]
MSNSEDYTFNNLDFYRKNHGQQLYYRWEGKVWWQQSSQSEWQKLFSIIGMNATKVFIRPDSEFAQVGYRINRELGLFCHPQTQEILHTWQPDATRPAVPIVHIANRIVQGSVKPRLTVIPQGQDYVTSVVEIPLTYPHPLAGDPQYRDYCPGETFNGTEYFTSHISRPEVKDLPPATWARNCPWLPWMKLGYGHPARLRFETTTARVDSFEQLHPNLIQLIRQKVPIYEFTPDHSDEANMTSTLYFKQHFDAYLRGESFPVAE